MDAQPNAFRSRPIFDSALRRVVMSTIETARAERLRIAQECEPEHVTRPRPGVASHCDTPIDPLELVWRAVRDQEEFTNF